MDKKKFRRSLRSTNDIVAELEDVLESVTVGQSPIEVADVRVRCCKHAIQVIALSYAMAKSEGLPLNRKLEHLQIK